MSYRDQDERGENRPLYAPLHGIISARFIRGFALNAIVVLTVSCTKLGPEFVRPEAPVADTWSSGGEEQTSVDTQLKPDEDDHSAWWSAFGDSVLDDLIDQAYRQNLSLRISGVRILEARAQLGIAIGNQYPQQQQLSGSLQHVEQSKHAPNFQPGLDTSYRNALVGFDAAWELDFFGRFRRGIESADAALAASMANYDNALVSLTAEVARTYIMIRTFQERLHLARENTAIQKRSLQITQVRFRNGATTELDVQQARALLHDTQATIPQLETGLRQAWHALSILLGMPPGELTGLLNKEGSIPTPPAEVAVGVPADLLRRRPDIRRVELQAAAQSARIGIAQADLYPSFSLTGIIGLQAGDTGSSNLGDLFKADSLVASVGPSISWPIFNYGRLENRVRIEDARLQQLLIAYQDNVLRAAREVEDAMVGFFKAQQRVEFLANGVKAARRSVDLALLQYRDGTTDYTRVLDTQEFLVEQQDALSATRGDVATNLVAMYKALGGGWQIRAGKPVVPDIVREQMQQRTDWGNLLTPAAVASESK